MTGVVKIRLSLVIRFALTKPFTAEVMAQFKIRHYGGPRP